MSCKNPNTADTESTELNLRSTAESYSKKTEWTTEIEGEKLTAKIPAADGIESSLSASPQNIFMSGNESSYSPVYPEITDFAILDTSALDSGALSTLDGFCNSITNNKDADSFIAKDQLYTLVLFLYDFKSEEKPLFSSYVLGKPFISDDETIECPARFYYNKEILKTAPAADNEQKTEPVEKIKGSAYDNSLDVNLYLIKEESTWKINQISYKGNL
ncbi:MAG: hypothetical protein WCQ67_00220 [Treponema sp.]